MPKDLNIPISIFDNQKLSALESIIKYLKENKKLRLSEIARLTRRDQRAVGVTYRFASKKMSLPLKVPASRYSLPISILAERKLSVLESLVHHLRSSYNLSYREVAVLIKRDDRTIWTVYQRALRKLKKE